MSLMLPERRALNTDGLGEDSCIFQYESKLSSHNLPEEGKDRQRDILLGNSQKLYTPSICVSSHKGVWQANCIKNTSGKGFSEGLPKEVLLMSHVLTILVGTVDPTVLNSTRK